MTDTAPPFWIDESPITLCQRVRLQRGRTSFFIVLVPMNGRIKSAMTHAGDGVSSVRILPCASMTGHRSCRFPPTRE